jgi:4-hydroxy-3-methylbut-2-enyl diphosphate reductase
LQTAGEQSQIEQARASKPLSMAQVMESDEFSNYMSGVDALQRGALMPGTVVRVDENTGEVLVDIGAKSECIIARNEVGDEPVNVGDEIEVVVLRPEDDDGHPVVSKRRADYEKTWRVIQQAKDKNTDVEGLVREQVKGGLIVDLGVPAFVPASHVDTRNRSDLSRFVGRTIPLRVIEIDRKRNKVIGSHRLAVQEDREKREAEAWAGLQKDKIVEGIVRRITDFGAFIDIGGIDGLLHVREMGWSRVEHPDSVVKKGQKLQVLILDIDEERKRVALGLKQLQSDPWKKAAKNYRVGQMVKGKVVRLAPSVAFVELEDGVEGIIPVGEISETRINEPGDVLAVGQEVEARIKQIQTNQRRISLSLKAAVQEREVREVRTQVREVNQRAMGGGSGGGGNSGGGNDDGGALRLGDVFGQQLRAARDRGKERNEARSEARARAMQAAEEEEEDFDVVDAVEDVEVTDDDEEV